MKKQTFALMILTTIVATGCARTPPCCKVIDETYVHKYGVTVPREDWSSRGQYGQVITTLDNGVIVTKSFSGGELDGDITYTFPHSNVVEKVETYSKGTKIKETTFDSAGNPQQESHFGDNIKTIVTRWFEGGAPQSREEFVNDRLMKGEYYTAGHHIEARIDNGQGTRLVRDIYGQLLSTDQFENGQMISTTNYHPNGNPKEIALYKNGLAHGERKSFLPAGEPEFIEQWRGGIQEGVSLTFKNGERYAEVPYSQGKKNGVEKHYRDQDTVIEEIAWLDDQLHGPSVTYVDGKVVKTEWYYQGRPVPKISYDLKTGQRRL